MGHSKFLFSEDSKYSLDRNFKWHKDKYFSCPALEGSWKLYPELIDKYKLALDKDRKILHEQDQKMAAADKRFVLDDQTKNMFK